MFKHLIKNFTPSVALALALGFAGCNIFNPTDSARVSDKDAPALTYEAYLHYQKNEYSQARKYFEKAIKADSSYSEAWFGRVKAVKNMQPGLDIFQLAAKTNLANGASAMDSVLALPDSDAVQIENGIDSVLFYLNPFINRDTLNLTDKKIRFKDFADSYSILQLVKLALTVRSLNIGLSDLLTNTKDFLTIDWSTMDVQEMGETVKEISGILASTASAIKTNPDLAAILLKEYIPDTSSITDSTVDANMEFFADQILYMNDAVQKNDLERTEVFINVGNARDDDGDGCVDEEIPDGLDNDGDGEIDEDLRHNNSYVMDIDLDNPQNSNPTKIREIQNISLYEFVDIDGNGIYSPADTAERTFVYPTKDREKKNALFKFAKKLDWKGDSSDIDARIANKEKARLDTDSTDIKYDLKWRQKNIGGCWNNYNEERFRAWFKGRGKK
ncbi:MAG: hypothetical protein HUK19_04975 [Fibrobacter sp.]|nr:hypothetical protein [Fibrobacter sp.]